jgi:hypothetical protein
MANTDKREADNNTGSVIRAELPAELASARQARYAIREALAAWGMDRLSGDAELLASELVANAAEHGDGKPISFALHRHVSADGPRGITCEVTATSQDLPRSRDLGPDAERGRGLAIVSLASASGVRADGRAGKTTWFTLALQDRAARTAALIGPEAEAEAGA